MHTRDQTKGSRRGAKTPRSTKSEWLPWGLYDDTQIPEFAEETIQEAANQLNATDDAKKAELRRQLRSVAVTYWRLRRDVVKPGPKWFRDQVKPIKKATERLYGLIHNHAGGIGLTPLATLTQRRMKRPLRNSRGPLGLQSESMEQLLVHFVKVCDECLKRRGSPGAKKQTHLRITTNDIVELWKHFTEKPIGLSLDKAPGRGDETEFTYPGPRFVHFILKAIDPQLNLAQTTTALREVLGPPGVGNSAET